MMLPISLIQETVNQIVTRQVYLRCPTVKHTFLIDPSRSHLRENFEAKIWVSGVALFHI